MPAIRLRPLASAAAPPGEPRHTGAAAATAWGYGGWYTPWYWTDGGGYYDADGTTAGAAPVATRRPAPPDGLVYGDGAQASGRWVRRGHQIVLYGI